MGASAGPAARPGAPRTLGPRPVGPCQTAKCYVRELGALSRLSGANRPPRHVSADWFPDDSLEAVGFEFTSTPSTDSAMIDSRCGPMTAAPAPASWCSTVTTCRRAPPGGGAAGGRVRTSCHERLRGYLDFVTEDETTSRVPDRRPRPARRPGWTPPRGGRRPSGPPRVVAVTPSCWSRTPAGSHVRSPDRRRRVSRRGIVWIAAGVRDRRAARRHRAPVSASRRADPQHRIGQLLSGPAGLHVIARPPPGRASG